MEQYSGYVDQPGLLQAINAGGISTYMQGGALWVSDLAAAQSIAASYDPLPYVKLQAQAEVMATLTAKLAAGFTYSGVLIAIDPQDRRSKLAEAYSLASAIQSGTSTEVWDSNREWPPMTGTTGVPVSTTQEMINLAAAVGSYVMDLDLYAGSLVSQITGATSASAVATILSNAVWPTK